MEHICGYPLCSTPLLPNDRRRRGQYRIDVINKRVVDNTDMKVRCQPKTKKKEEEEEEKAAAAADEERRRRKKRSRKRERERGGGVPIAKNSFYDKRGVRVYFQSLHTPTFSGGILCN